MLLDKSDRARKPGPQGASIEGRHRRKPIRQASVQPKGQHTTRFTRQRIAGCDSIGVKNDLVATASRHQLPHEDVWLPVLQRNADVEQALREFFDDPVMANESQDAAFTGAPVG